MREYMNKNVSTNKIVSIIQSTIYSQSYCIKLDYKTED